MMWPSSSTPKRLIGPDGLHLGTCEVQRHAHGVILLLPLWWIRYGPLHARPAHRAQSSPCLPNCLPIGSTWPDQTGTQANAHHAQRRGQALHDLG
jgi:hypothetical protein